MAFDLVQYFAEQIKIQKPQLLNQYSVKEKAVFIQEINALALARLVSLWKQNAKKLYQEIKTSDPLYIQEIARHLTTSQHNQSALAPNDLETSISEILVLQLNELNQLDQTGHFGQIGMSELLLGQIEHLSGQAEDWVWSNAQLNELIGSKPVEQTDISLEATMQEFNQMVNQAQPHHNDITEESETNMIVSPKWAYIISPLTALVILLVMYCSYSQLIIY